MKTFGRASTSSRAGCGTPRIGSDCGLLPSSVIRFHSPDHLVIASGRCSQWVTSGSVAYWGGAGQEMRESTPPACRRAPGARHVTNTAVIAQARRNKPIERLPDTNGVKRTFRMLASDGRIYGCG